MTRRRPIWPLLAWSVLGACVAAGAYVVMIRTGYGQRLDFSAFEGRKWTSLWARRRATFAVRALTPLSVVVVAIGSVVVGYLRRGLLAAAAVGLAVPVTLVVARTAKSGLPRSELMVGSWISTGNTFPSGHTAAACTAALCAIAVSPPVWRGRVAGVAVAALGLQVLGMGVTGWHRPSDLMGGLGVAVLVSGVASAVVVRRWRGPALSAAPEWFERPVPALVALGATAAGTLVWYVVTRLLGSSSYGRFDLHLVVATATVLMSAAVVLAHSRLANAADVGRSPLDER